MMRIFPLFFALTVSSFGLPPSARDSPSVPPYLPCDTDSGQMYPHRRSLSLPYHRRQFVGEQVIPGQGKGAPPPSTKYIISEAVIEQGGPYKNQSQNTSFEGLSVLVANASEGSQPVTCSIYYNPPGSPDLGYPLDCENYAFCAILTQQSQNPGVGFYLYISLP